MAVVLLSGDGKTVYDSADLAVATPNTYVKVNPPKFDWFGHPDPADPSSRRGAVCC